MLRSPEPGKARGVLLEGLLIRAERIDLVRFNIGLMVVIVVLSAFFSIALWALAVGLLGWTVPPGSGLLVFLIASLVSFAVGAPAVYFGFALIRRIQSIEQELRLALAAADLANRSKTEFLANMSHEVRTPLNGVLGMARMLETSTLDDQQREALRVIRQSGDVLMALLSEVLDLSRIDSGQVKLDPVSQPLEPILSTCVELFRARAMEGGNDLTFAALPGIPERVSYDSVRVRQCLANLISNAVKFTRGGRISIQLSARGLPDGWLIRLRVSDTGIGIAEQDLPRLFRPFQQAGPAESRTHGGTGLGLAISHRLARLMGGDLTVRSVEGEGSDFHLSFKAGPADLQAVEAQGATGAEPAGDAGLAGLRVLVVDDVATNRLVVKAMLQAMGAACSEAANGAAAVALAARETFDVILLDIHMPDLDGFGVLAKLRALPGTQASVPVIALTADVFSGTPEDYAGRGFVGYLSKPLQIEDLAREIRNAVAGSVAGGAGPRAVNRLGLHSAAGEGDGRAGTCAGRWSLADTG